MLKQQQFGFGLLSMLVRLFVLGFCLLLLARIVPVYLEYFAIKRSLETVSQSFDHNNFFETKQRFQKQLDLNSIQYVRGKDLTLVWQRGQYALVMPYQKTVPLFANVSLLFQFKPSISVK